MQFSCPACEWRSSAGEILECRMVPQELRCPRCRVWWPANLVFRDDLPVSDEPRTYEGVDGYSRAEETETTSPYGFTALINTIRHDRHPYPTVGNWWTDSWTPHRWQIRVSRLGDWRYEFLVAIHELVEMALCKSRGISERAVTDYDLKFAKAHPGGRDEPGDGVGAPYRAEHRSAENIERLVAQLLGVDWFAYEAAIDRLEEK